MKNSRADAIAQLLNQQPYIAVDGNGSDYGHMDNLHIAQACSLNHGRVEMTFTDRPEPTSIMQDWLFVEPDGTIRAGGWAWMPLLFRLIPSPQANDAAVRATGQAINAQFSRV